MEDVDDEKEMTQAQLMRDLDGVTRRYAMTISNKYTSEQLESQIGKETGVVFIAVPIEWIKGGNTPRNRQPIANRVDPYSGTQYAVESVHLEAGRNRPGPCQSSSRS